MCTEAKSVSPLDLKSNLQDRFGEMVCPFMTGGLALGEDCCCSRGRWDLDGHLGDHFACLQTLIRLSDATLFLGMVAQ